MRNKYLLPEAEKVLLLKVLQTRFEKNRHRHKNTKWEEVLEKIEKNQQKLWSLNEMEKTGGEPDLICGESKNNECIFYDCASESPKLRRSICYDREGLLSRKDFPPSNTALDMATEMGIQLLTEEQYRYLQQFESFDVKTSSWIATPDSIRKLGGALFCDRRYNRVFVYHNGAGSYYAARGFRGCLSI